MVMVLVGYIIGIIWGLYFNISIAPFSILVLAIFYWIQRFQKKKNNIVRYLKVIFSKKFILIVVCSSILSNTLVLFQNNQYQNLYQETEEGEFVAFVVSNENRKEYKSTYQIKVKTMNGKKQYQSTKLILSIKEEGVLQYGDRIHFKGEYQKPSQAKNEGGFDYVEYLKTIGVYGTVQVNKKEIQIEKKESVPFIFLFANQVKQTMIKQSNTLLPENHAKLLQGILLGETTNLEEETIENFRNSSLYHMLAVSGAHISYLIWGCQLLFNKLEIKKRNIITILVLFFSMFVTNFSASVVRACIMGSLTLGAEVCHRKSNFLNNICMALLVILISNSYAIQSLSVLLSFGGTIGIVLFSKQIQQIFQKEGILIKTSKIKDYLKEALSVTTSAQVMILPVISSAFHTISITFFLSNSIAAIMIGPIILLGFLCIFLSLLSIYLAKLVVIPLSILLFLLEQIAKYTATLPGSKIYIISIPFIFILSYYLILIVISRYLKIREKEKRRRIENLFLKKVNSIPWKKVMVILVVFVLIFQVVQAQTRQFTIYFIDVGQGDSCLVITKHNKKILIDGGGSENSSFDVGKQTLIPYLLNRGVRTLDYVMISHFDTDHCGGILTVMENLKVKVAIISEQGEDSYNYQRFLTLVKEKHIKVKIVKAGDNIQIDQDTYFDILWPKEKQLSENILNNNSIVAKLVYGNFSMLFTGDVEEIAEREIVKRYGKTNHLQSTILKTAHHGSKTSSTQEILEKIKPQYALIGVGENNKFGHPSDDVLDRLNQLRCNNLSNR